MQRVLSHRRPAVDRTVVGVGREPVEHLEADGGAVGADQHVSQPARGRRVQGVRRSTGDRNDVETVTRSVHDLRAVRGDRGGSAKLSKGYPQGFCWEGKKKNMLDDRLLCYWLRVLAKLIGLLDGNEAHSLSRSPYIHANIHNTQHETSSVKNNSSCEATAE